MVMLAVVAYIVLVGGGMTGGGFSDFVFDEPIGQGDDGEDSYQADNIPVAVVDYFANLSVRVNGKNLSVVVHNDQDGVFVGVELRGIGCAFGGAERCGGGE